MRGEPAGFHCESTEKPLGEVWTPEVELGRQSPSPPSLEAASPAGRIRITQGILKTLSPLLEVLIPWFKVETEPWDFLKASGESNVQQNLRTVGSKQQ